jgi:hypothetical protein
MAALTEEVRKFQELDRRIAASARNPGQGISWNQLKIKKKIIDSHERRKSR